MNERAGQFRGLPVKEAREAVIKALKEKDLLVKVDEHYKNRVGKCYKCGTIIEPMLMEQWFVDMQRLSEPAISALEDKKIKFYPDNKRVQLINYLQGLKDWNLSRQIAWGIPIPAFQNVDDSDDWIYDERVDQEFIEIDGKRYHRDPDVFDTWFSSSQWPYATLDYPDSEDFKKFYPNDLMETGADILYPWVSRMIMMGLYRTGEIPFKTVYLHGLVRGTDGQKMSKSKGNIVNPIALLEEYGADALRIGLITNAVAGANQPSPDAKAPGGRNFCNKLWNIARFIEEKIGDKSDQRHQPEPQTEADHWILSRLQQSTEVVTKALDNYRFGEAWDAVYHLTWDDFADWYIEASKSSLNHSVLAFGLETILKLAHPFAPFVTETIWQTLAWEKGQLITAEWPKSEVKFDKEKAGDFALIQTVVTETRQMITNLGLPHPRMYYHQAPFIAERSGLIKQLARLDAIEEVEAGQGLHLTSVPFKVWMAVDVDTARHYRSRLDEKRAELEQSVKQLEGRLANKAYVKNAPRHVVAQTKDQLAETKALLSQVGRELASFEQASKDI
jgi:valyl-tRNA synthetase